VVNIDAHFAVVVPLVAERVLDLGDAVVRCGVEVVLAHRLGGRAVEVDLVVVEDDLFPAHAARPESEALVLGVATRDLVAADEVREGALGRGAEGRLRGLGRLEEHVGASVAVELVRCFLGDGHEVAAR